MILDAEVWKFDDVLRKIAADLATQGAMIGDNHLSSIPNSSWSAPAAGWVKLNVDGSCNKVVSSIACGGAI